MTKDLSTTTQCTIVAGTAFCCSCAAFALSILLLIPVFGSTLDSLHAPSIVQQGVILFCLIGIPIIAAIRGIDIGAQFID